MEKRDKIVVFRDYESVIDANVAKTKLDAYGVPCFLTQENMNTLMAQNPLLFTTKLHIFENDALRVQEVLDDQFDYETPISCPQCESTEIIYSESRKGINKFAAVAFAILFHIPMTPKKVHHCLDCRLEF